MTPLHQPKTGLQHTKQQCQQQELAQLGKKESEFEQEIDHLVGTNFPCPFVQEKVSSQFVKKENNMKIYLSFGLKNNLENFVAGKTRLYQEKWSEISNDRWVRNTIRGYKIETEELPVQTYIPKPIQFPPEV